MPDLIADPLRALSGVLNLGASDAAEIGGLTAGRRYTPDVLAAELADPFYYRWIGIRRTDGGLAAVHRALRWGEYLFLKGVFVEETSRGGDGALRLAFALREQARSLGVRGTAAWISDSSPAQLALARRLRLRRAGSPLHLYTLPFAEFRDARIAVPAAPGEAELRVEEILASRHDSGSGRLLVPDLLRHPGQIEEPRRSATRRALPDRDRLLLSSLPCTDPAGLCTLLAELAAPAAALRVQEAEFPVPAGDIPLALWLAGRKARRVSARPVHVGRADFVCSWEEIS